MIDVFDDRKEVSQGFFHYSFWIMGWIMFSTYLITLFMKDAGLIISKDQWKAATICSGIGIGILLFRVLVIEVNDIKYLLKVKKVRK